MTKGILIKPVLVVCCICWSLVAWGQDYSPNLIEFANSREKELFERVESLQENELIELVMIADDPSRSTGQNQQFILELKEIANTYRTKKYSKGSTVKRGIKVHKAFAKRFYRIGDRQANLENLIRTGDAHLNTLLIVLGLIYQELGIDFKMVVDETGWFMYLDPKGQNYPLRVGTSLQDEMTVSPPDLAEFLRNYVASGNTSGQAYSIDSTKANGLPRNTSFWRQMAYGLYFKKAYDLHQANQRKESLSHFIKAHRLAPCENTRIAIFGAVNMSISFASTFKDFWQVRDLWVALINNYQTEIEGNFQHLFDGYAHEELVKQGRIDSVKIRYDFLIANITDSVVLRDIRFSYYSLLAVFKAYNEYSRGFISPYKKALEIYPKHARLSSIAVDGVLNYVKKNLTVGSIYDTLLVLASALPEIETSTQFKSAKFNSCIYAAWHQLNRKDIGKTVKYCSAMEALECPSDDLEMENLESFYREYSTYYVQQGKLAKARKALTDGMKMMEKCNFESSILNERYQLIKGVKSLY